MRGLLETSRDTEDFETQKWIGMPLLVANRSRMTNWLWDYITTNYSGSELATLQVIIFRDFTQYIAKDGEIDKLSATLQLLVPKMAKPKLLLDGIALGNIGALESVWDALYAVEDLSQKIGSCYMALLTSLGVDVKHSIEAELEKLPGWILQDKGGILLDRKVLFYQNEEQEWVLRWEWVLDKEAFGHDLCSEFPQITLCSFGSDWPFHDHYWDLPYDDRHHEGPNWDARYARRIANTTRKELARTGQKRTRSKMPGAWI